MIIIQLLAKINRLLASLLREVFASQGGGGNSMVEKIKRRRHIGDFSNWKVEVSYKKAFERLLRDLKARPN